MKIKNQVLSAIAFTLSHSLGLKLTLRLAKEFIPDYNINERTGYPPSMPIPPLDAARAVARDLANAGFLLEMIEWLIKIQRYGFMGEKYEIAGLPGIILAIRDSGYELDEETQIFFENPKINKTLSWGRLREGVQYPLTFIKIDIVNNSSLVRENAKSKIEGVYKDFFNNLYEIIEKRNGRIWLCEGDGLIAAFYYSHPATSAVLSGIEILNKLKIFNISENTLDRDLDVRIAVHSGHIPYTEEVSLFLKAETIRELNQIEQKWTPTGTMVISAAIALHIESILLETMYRLKTNSSRELLAYMPEFKGAS